MMNMHFPHPQLQQLPSLQSKTGSRLRTSVALILMAVLSMQGMTPALAASTASAKNNSVMKNINEGASFNFVGADIESVIKAIGEYANLTFIIDPRVKGTINLVSERKLSKGQALDLLASVLRLNGYAMVLSDGYAKVLPEADAKLQLGAPQAASKLRGDQLATQIFRLNYESANNLVTVLRPLISPNNTINANPGNNTLVITDYAENLRRLEKIISSLDTPAAADVDVVPIRFAIASDIAALAGKLLDASGSNPIANAAAAAGNADGGRINLLADARTNSVLIRAPSVARANLARALIAKLDQPTTQPGNVHVVYLRNADAGKLAKTLRAVVSGDSSAIPDAASSLSNNDQSSSGIGGNTNGSDSSATSAASPFGTSKLNAQTGNTNGGVPASASDSAAGFIQADRSTNSLIITASEPVYRNLRAIIDQLDMRRAQVYIESLIVEVSANVATELGVQWAGATGNSGSDVRLGAGTGFSTGGDNLINQLASFSTTGRPAGLPGNGLTLGIFNQRGLGVLLRALQTDTDTNVLSVPNLITLDNEEARIIVGQNVPFLTGQYATNSAGSTGVAPFQTVERKDIGVSLKVRPQISDGGTIKLDIYQEVSSIADKTNPSGIITNKRSIESSVLVDDGQIIVLGGLIGDDVSETNEKVPVLGDLPVVGNLFKYRSRTRNKTNLMVFLRPIVIRDNNQSQELSTNRYDYIRKLQIDAEPDQKKGTPSPTISPMIPEIRDGIMQAPVQMPPSLPPKTPPLPPSPPSDTSIDTRPVIKQDEQAAAVPANSKAAAQEN